MARPGACLFVCVCVCVCVCVEPSVHVRASADVVEELHDLVHVHASTSCTCTPHLVHVHASADIVEELHDLGRVDPLDLLFQNPLPVVHEDRLHFVLVVLQCSLLQERDLVDCCCAELDLLLVERHPVEHGLYAVARPAPRRVSLDEHVVPRDCVLPVEVINYHLLKVLDLPAHPAAASLSPSSRESSRSALRPRTHVHELLACR
mmetsp:Transcript_38429/g.94505  ORF Transcript_38429/g.94505 Transcript_38429/m.94505 type:complete len:205 (-) Transcript_38429:6-620(-)